MALYRSGYAFTYSGALDGISRIAFDHTGEQLYAAHDDDTFVETVAIGAKSLGFEIQSYDVLHAESWMNVAVGTALTGNLDGFAGGTDKKFTLAAATLLSAEYTLRACNWNTVVIRGVAYATDGTNPLSFDTASGSSSAVTKYRGAQVTSGHTLTKVTQIVIREVFDEEAAEVTDDQCYSALIGRGNGRIEVDIETQDVDAAYALIGDTANCVCAAGDMDYEITGLTIGGFAPTVEHGRPSSVTVRGIATALAVQPGS